MTDMPGTLKDYYAAQFLNDTPVYLLEDPTKRYKTNEELEASWLVVRWKQLKRRNEFYGLGFWAHAQI